MSALNRGRRSATPQQLDDGPSPSTRDARLAVQRALTTFAPILDRLLASEIDEAGAVELIRRGRKTVTLALEQAIGVAPPAMVADVMDLWCRHAAAERELDAGALRVAVSVALSGMNIVWGGSEPIIRSFPFTDRTFMVSAMTDIAAELDEAIAETGDRNPALLPAALDHIAAASVRSARRLIEATAPEKDIARDIYNLAQNLARRIGHSAVISLRRDGDTERLFEAIDDAAGRLTNAIAIASSTTDHVASFTPSEDQHAPCAPEPQEPAWP